jgi:hypothetical protein
MTDTVGHADISGVARRRKVIGFGAFAGQLLAVAFVIVVVDLVRGYLGQSSGGSLPLEPFVLLDVGLACAMVWLVRRLRSADRAVAWPTVAIGLVFVTVLFVGLPLQAAGRLHAPTLSRIMELHRPLGEWVAEVTIPAAWLATIPVVFLAADSAPVRRWKRVWRWIALTGLAILVLFAFGVGLFALGSVVEPWLLAVLLIYVPLTAIVIPGLAVILTDSPRTIGGVDVPAAAEPALPSSTRRMVKLHWDFASRLLQAISVILVVAAWLNIRRTLNLPPGEANERFGRATWEWIVAIGLLSAAVAIGRAARARAMPTAQQMAMFDRRPPILYLRSFLDDDLRIRTRRSARRGFLGNLTSIQLLAVLVRTRERFEEILVWQLWLHGPVIAVGDPVRRKFRLGSPRFYLSNDRWADEIQPLMSSARFVVMVLGRTEGVAWELQCLGRLGLANKLLIVLPPVADDEAQARSRSFSQIATQAGLPSPPDQFDHALTAVLSPDGSTWQTVSSKHRDECSYEIALESAVVALATAATTGTVAYQSPAQ